MRLDPNFWEAHNLLGEELAFTGRPDEAQKEFEPVLKLDPNHALANLNLGVAVFKQDQREGAMRQFETARRLDLQLRRAQQYLEQLRSHPLPAAPGL